VYDEQTILHTYCVQTEYVHRSVFPTVNKCIQILLLTFGKIVISICLHLKKSNAGTWLWATPSSLKKKASLVRRSAQIKSSASARGLTILIGCCSVSSRE
jgi:hypothetical protein